jgi:precorrin-4/cobalt-precorrin-4 C11-methyltransferase
MKVYIVGAGPGNPEWLTVAADRLLRGARICIYAGSLVNPEILDLLPADCERYDSARLCLDEIIVFCVEAQKRNIDVVRLHTGEPSLYGAIGEQSEASSLR